MAPGRNTPLTHPIFKNAFPQLFGDTVNTASRMESTGKGNMIHISGTTANLLAKAGKSHWFRQREDTVTAKGKGVVQTYWMNPPHKMRDASVTSGSSSGHHVRANLDSSYVVNKSTNEERLINWMQELFVQDIRKIVSIVLASAKLVLAMLPPPLTIVYFFSDSRTNAQAH